MIIQAPKTLIYFQENSYPSDDSQIFHYLTHIAARHVLHLSRREFFFFHNLDVIAQDIESAHVYPFT